MPRDVRVRPAADKNVRDPFSARTTAMIRRGEVGLPEFYDATGALTAANTSSAPNPYLFTGRRWDEELGYYYYRNRYMDPALGRFTSRDPIGIWGDGANMGNGYTYAASNPWSLVDPFGLASGGNMAALRAEYEALQDNRSRESFWAGVGGFFSFGREDAVLATEAVSYIPIVGWGADAVLLAEAIERGDTFDTIMAGIGFIPILGDGAKAVVDTGGRAIRGFKALRKGANVLEVPGGGGLPSSIPKINVDTGTANAFVSEGSSVRHQLKEHVQGKQMVMTETALAEFQGTLRVAGPNEAERAQRFLQRVKAIPDNPSARAQNLNVTKKVGANDIVIFGTADNMSFQTMTSDAKFLRGASAQGVDFDAFVHMPVPLTGK